MRVFGWVIAVLSGFAASGIASGGSAHGLYQDLYTAPNLRASSAMVSSCFAPPRDVLSCELRLQGRYDLARCACITR